jgi:hypothetical protein
MPGPRDLLVRTTLSGLAVGGFLLLLAAAPSAHGERSPRETAAHAPKPAPLPQPGTFTFNGIPMDSEEIAVPACDARTWNPLTAGYCAGHCIHLSEQRTSQGATFAWRDEATGSIHSLALSCPVAGGTGRASHFSFATSALLANATRPATGPLRPRVTPVPGLPGAVEVVHLESGGLTLFVDRPSSASTALEELQLVLFPQGWRLAGGPAFSLPTDAPPARVFVRGAEVFVATLETPDDDSQPPLLVSAYSRHGWAPEAPQ